MYVATEANVNDINSESLRVMVFLPKVDSVYEYKNNMNFIENSWENSIVCEQEKNDFAWKDMDKVYVTFCFDDANSDISDIVNLFKTKSVPCCLAVPPPSRLTAQCNNGETVLDVCNKCVENDGEILVHGFNTLTSESTEEDYKSVIIDGKRTLYQNGLDTNGIITIGGNNWNTADFSKCVKMMRPYYKYSDLYGYGTGVIQYSHPRSFLSSNVSGNRNDIAVAINNFKSTNKGSWVSLACHGTNDLVQGGAPNNSANVEQAMTVLSDLLDWCKDRDEVEITTFLSIHDKFKSSKLEQRIKRLE